MFILNKNNLRRQQGFSVIEVIIALGISTIIVSGIIGLLVQSMKYTRWSEHRWQASSYAAGAIDAVVNIKENDWQTVAAYATDGTVYRLTTSGGQWQLVPDAGGETLGIYTRVITFSQVCRDGANAIAPCGGGNLPDPDSRKITVTMNWTESEGNSRSLQLEQYLMNWPVCYARWPYIYGSRYSYDTDKIEVTGGQASLINRTAQIIDNGNFQTGDFTDWLVTGNAWEIISTGGGVYFASTENHPERLGEITSSTFTSAGQQLRFRHKGFATNSTITDDDQTDFDAGSYTETQWDGVNNWVELTGGGQLAGNGYYTSSIKDAGAEIAWQNLAWVSEQPTCKNLPNGGIAESGYSSGNIDMSGNKVLFHLNDTSGIDTFDDSGQSNNATCSACPTKGVAGKLGTAYEFNGIDQYISTTADLTQWLGSTATVSYWIKTTQVGDATFWSAPGIVGVESAGDGNDIFWGWIDNTGRIGFNIGDSGGVKSNSPVNDNNWHNITMTRNQSTGEIQLYVDGQYQDGGTFDTGSKTTSFFSVGRIEDTGGTPEYYQGMLDEFTIWDEVVSPTMINDIYERGAICLKYQVRSCDDASCDTEDFIGPDGTNTTYYSELMNDTSGLPALILANVPNNRYFQYRAIFNTSDSALTPELRSVSTDGGASNYVGIYRAGNNEWLGRVDAPNNVAWQDVIIDLSAYPNQEIYLKAVDNSTDVTNGWYAVDDFRQTDSDGNAIAGYATNRPTITPNESHSITALTNWYSFAADNSGTGTVYYQLSSDNGATWYFWNGLAWVVAGPTDYSVASDINDNISSFPAGNYISVRAFLASDGTQPVFLDEVVVAYEGECGL